MRPIARKLFVQTLVGRLLLGMVVLAGLLSYNNMVRENYPDLEIPQAIVMTFWPGAAPEQIEKEITKHLEDEIRSLKGLKSFSSGSYNSYSIVAVEFDADMPMAESMQLLRAAVDKAEAEFPADGSIEKPDIEEMSVSNMPVISWVLSGDVDDILLSDTAKQLETQFENLPLVKKVNLNGMREKSLHVRLKMDRLRDLGISPLLVRERLQSANHDMAWGEFESDENTFNLYLSGRFVTVEQVRQLPITRLSDNRPVRLGEVAEVSHRLDREVSRTFFSINNQAFEPGITLDVLKHPGADTFAVIASTQHKVDQLTSRSDWPQGLSLSRVSDDGELIELAFNDISSSMKQAVIIVFIVLMLLLSWREALVAGIALPVTLLATLAVMASFGYSFNSMIMIGMVLALGLMVDVYILVMEGMHEGLYVKKLSFAEAAIETVRQFILPATAGQLTTILAMVPMMMVGGIDGKFIRILPITITVTLLISLLIAFLICIPLSRYILEKAANNDKELLIDKLSSRYRHQLRQWLATYVLKNKRRAAMWVGATLVLFVASILLVGLMPSEMYPESDDRKIGVSLVLAPDSTLEQSQRAADKAGEFLRQQPWIEKVITYVGAKSPMTTASLNDALLPSQEWNQVGFSLTLYPKDQRDKLSFEYLEEIRSGIQHALYDEPGIEIALVHIGGNPDTSAPIQIDLIGSDYTQLIANAAEVKAALAQVPGSSDINDNLGPARHEVRFSFKHEMLSFHQLSESDVSQQIRVAMEQDEIGHFKIEGIDDDAKMRLSVLWPSRGDSLGGPRHLSEMQLLHIISQDGRAVPLTDLVDYQIVETPRVFVHKEGQRAVTVSSRTEGRTAGEVITILQPQLDQLQAQWPTGYYYQLGGEMAKADESYSAMGTAFVLAMFSIFILLTLMFNSFAQPAIILLIVPLALMGTFFGYFLSGTAMSFSGLIGIVSLAGIAVNNGIVLVDTMNRHLRRGESVAQAAAYGAAERLRPILSTSLTTILSLLPLAYSDPQWYPLCMAIIYGLVASTIIAIVIIPALYILLTKPLGRPVTQSA
ncbi:efflux RND transporter permease subunit [Photobacterium lutimaris]|uniref:AcrB/AcrD/AcrF family protein n=2 Tax=Photobacterium TaxID=657 RepID=A0A2T3IV29_9GAMM|nr:efflux RND transporter permease subunit [Photobacterium lutimaris]PSU32262.1 AcrB/AcrD/AcrF family protein [Photobacterium lutimaris]TDR73134.1 multidrug efflux pump subunit AcrB [Photobacterium lutimaris]